MELQWPLIIFTTLVAWSSGLFATQCLFALKGGTKKAQIPAWITSAALLVVGGIAVCFHLEHFERIFNGFGHLSSGITQELIAIVVLALVAVAFLVFLRKSGDGQPPAWICVVGVAVAVLTVAIMSHSYAMVSRPAWDTVFWILYVVGNACLLGPATMALILSCVDPQGDMSVIGPLSLVGSAISVVTAIAYGAAFQLSADSFVDVGTYFDPTTPTASVVNAANVIASQAPLVWGGGVLVGTIAALGLVFLARKKGNWRLLSAIAVACAVVGAVCMRVAFYNAGLSVFALY